MTSSCRCHSVGIFEEFDEDSDEEEEEEEEDEEDDAAVDEDQLEGGPAGATQIRKDEKENGPQQSSDTWPSAEALRKLILEDFPDDEPYEAPVAREDRANEGGAEGENEDDAEDDEGTGVRTSQLRHFVIQVSSGLACQVSIPLTMERTAQEYVDRPLLFSVDRNTPTAGHKVRPPASRLARLGLTVDNGRSSISAHTSS